MRKLSIILTTVIVLSLSSGVALAATSSETLPNPGLTPDSPFYFLEQWMDSISMFFTFSKDGKAQKALSIANEKLAEAKKMAEKGEQKAEAVAEKDYEKYMDEATQYAGQSKATGKTNALEQIQDATARHEATMQKVLNQVPEQAKASIQKAIDESAKGHENAMEAINGEKKDQNEQPEVSEPKEQPEQPSNSEKPEQSGSESGQ